MFQILLSTKGYLSSLGKNKEPQRNFEVKSTLGGFDVLNKGHNLLRVMWAGKVSTVICTRAVEFPPHTSK